MTEDIIIRNADMKDLDFIYQFICKLEGEIPRKEDFESLFREELENSDSYYLLAEKDGKPVAFAGMQIHNALHHTAKIAEVVEMYVLREYRSSGIGEKLYWQTKDIALEKKCKFIQISCNIVRERAIEFFTDLGFQKTHYKLTERL